MIEPLLLSKLLFLDESSKDDQAVAYMADMAHEDPELFKDLERQAKLALVGLRNHAKPKQKVNNLKTLFSWNNEFDPTEAGDTYGVRAFITALSRDHKEAGKAKRFYDRTVDAFFKGLYGDKAEKISQRKTNDSEEKEDHQR